MFSSQIFRVLDYLVLHRLVKVTCLSRHTDTFMTRDQHFKCHQQSKDSTTKKQVRCLRLTKNNNHLFRNWTYDRFLVQQFEQLKGDEFYLANK